MNETLCRTCGQVMVSDVRPMVLTYKEKSTEVMMPGRYCSCGESVHSGKEMAISDLALTTLKARSEGILEPYGLGGDVSQKDIVNSPRSVV